MTFVEKTISGRRFAIGDIHGCLKTLECLLIDRIKIKKKDQVFLLGDYINRGPDSFGVIELILKLKGNGYSIYPIRGNHEEMHINSGEKIFSDEGENLIKELPHYIKTEGYYLVHAGFNYSISNPLNDKKNHALGKLGWSKTYR